MKLPNTQTIERFIQTVSPVRFFVIMALLFGSIFALVTPPFQTPDEPVHFYRAYQVSTLNLTVDGNGGKLPKSLGDIVLITTTNPQISFRPDQKYLIGKTHAAMNISTNPSTTADYDFVATAGYPPISYAPQATAIAVARFVHLRPIYFLYAARFANLAVWTTLFALAIRLLPKRKWALVFIGLVPSGIFQAVSVGADAVVIGLIALFMASILYINSQKAISRKWLVLLITLASVMAISKQVMFVFLPLVLILPNKIFNTRHKAYISKTLLIGIPLLLVAGWSLFAHGTTIVGTAANNQNPTQQLKFILHSPQSFINVLWNTYFYFWGDPVTRSFIGNFGWADTPLSELLTTMGYITMFLIFTASTNFKVWLTKVQKTVIVGVLVLYWLAVSAALYLFYTPPGFKIIVGLQGRYFLPLAIILIPLLYGGWLKVRPTVYRRIAILTPTLMLLVSTITLYVRYYIKNV